MNEENLLQLNYCDTAEFAGLSQNNIWSVPGNEFYKYANTNIRCYYFNSVNIHIFHCYT